MPLSLLHRSLEERLYLPLLLTLSTLCFVVGCNLGVGRYDEGIIALGATRVMGGELPYRDFWAIYSPGQFYVVAFLYRIFGTGLLVGRLYTTAVDVFVVAAAYRVSFLITGARKSATWTWLLTTGWLGASGFYLYPSTPGILAALIAGLLIHRSLSTPRPLWPFLAGVTSGVVCLFRHDFGVYAFLAGLVVFCANKRQNKPGATDLLSNGPKWLFYAIGMAATVTPVACALMAEVGPTTLYSVFVDFPVNVYARFRGLPYPGPFDAVTQVDAGTLRIAYHRFLNLVYWFPIAIFLVCGYRLLHRAIRDHGSLGPRDWLTCFVLVFGAGTLNNARIRPDVAHITAPLMMALALVPQFLSLSTYRAAHLRSSGYLLHLIVVTLTAAVGLYCVRGKGIELLTLLQHSADLRASRLPRARGIWLNGGTERSLQDATEFVRRTSQQGKAIYVGNTRHDQILVNDVMFYFLAERPPATRYHELHPGVATTEHVQRQIVAALELGRVRDLVLWAGGLPVKEPNGSGSVLGSSVLDEYIRSRFVCRQRFGEYTIWEAKTKLLVR